MHSSFAELTDFISAAQISKAADVLLGDLPVRVIFLSCKILYFGIITEKKSTSTSLLTLLKTLSHR